MAQRLVLHIGSMKSGTSFVQNVLSEHRDRLAEQGVRFAGERWRDQVRGVEELMRHGGPQQPPVAEDGPWARLVADVDAWPGTALVSMEFLGPRLRPKVQQLLASFPGTRVEVVLTARDLARQVTSMWLESMQNGASVPWEQYVAELRRPERDTRSAKAFWRQQDVAAMAARWAGAVGHDAFTLVTLPPPGAGPDLLWSRFCEAAGIDGSGFDLQVRPNAALGLSSALLMQRLNERLAASDHAERYDRFVKQGLAKRGLAGRAGEARLGLDDPWFVEAGAEQVAALRASGVRVVGDLDELLPGPVRGADPADVTDGEVLEAALDAVEFLLDQWARAHRKGRRRERRQTGQQAGQQPGEDD